MANFGWTLTFRDDDGHTSTTSGNLVAADLAAATAALEAIAEAADVLVGSVITGAAIQASIDMGAWTLKASAATNSDVEIGGRFIFRTVQNFFTHITLPGFLKDTYSAVGGLIDSANANVLAFISSIVTGGGSTSHYEDIISYNTGYETFNGKR